jgi:hypothetical protein
MGTVTNKPTITAPEFFQSFPHAFQLGSSINASNTNIFAQVDALVTGGRPADNISAVDVDTSQVTWRGLIDFDAHFDFITALFAASKRDFATLAWRAWRVGTATNGIPVLRMEAGRVDDLVSLNLGDIIERFRLIFEVPAASAPNAAARVKLNQLQPHLITFKTKSDAVAAGPAAADLPQLFTDLTTLAGSITVVGFPPPASPLAPVSNLLADIQSSVTRMETYLDTTLDVQLNSFFTAVQGKTAHANARIRYYYNVGLPLLLQSSANPVSFLISVFVGAASNATASKLLASALRSWMRIQWTGTATQTATMNAVIQGLVLTTSSVQDDASRVSMLTEDDPDVPATPAGIAPMQAFHDHLVTRP